MSHFLYKLSYLIHCKNFVDVFSPIIVIVASRNMIFYVLMKKSSKCEPQYFTFLMSKFFTVNIQWNLGPCRDLGAFLIEFLKNFISWQHEASAEKMCQIVIISQNSEQFEKLNICIVCYITNHQKSLISKFILYHLQS